MELLASSCCRLGVVRFSGIDCPRSRRRSAATAGGSRRILAAEACDLHWEQMLVGEGTWGAAKQGKYAPTASGVASPSELPFPPFGRRGLERDL